MQPMTTSSMPARVQWHRPSPVTHRSYCIASRTTSTGSGTKGSTTESSGDRQEKCSSVGSMALPVRTALVSDCCGTRPSYRRLTAEVTEPGATDWIFDDQANAGMEGGQSGAEGRTCATDDDGLVAVQDEHRAVSDVDLRGREACR